MQKGNRVIEASRFTKRITLLAIFSCFLLLGVFFTQDGASAGHNHHPDCVPVTHEDNGGAYKINYTCENLEGDCSGHPAYCVQQEDPVGAPDTFSVNVFHFPLSADVAERVEVDIQNAIITIPNIGGSEDFFSPFNAVGVVEIEDTNCYILKNVEAIHKPFNKESVLYNFLEVCGVEINDENLKERRVNSGNKIGTTIDGENVTLRGCFGVSLESCEALEGFKSTRESKTAWEHFFQKERFEEGGDLEIPSCEDRPEGDAKCLVYKEIPPSPEIKGVKASPQTQITWPAGTSLGGEEDITLNSLISDVFNIAIWVSVILAVASLVYAGMMYMASGASPELRKKAFSRFKKVILGSAILLSSVLILNFVNEDINEGGSLNWGDALGVEELSYSYEFDMCVHERSGEATSFSISKPQTQITWPAGTSLGGSEEITLKSLISDVFDIVIWVSVILSVASLVYAGMMYMASGASPELRKKAFSRFKKVVLGSAILLSSVLILNFVNEDINKEGALRLDEVVPVEQEQSLEQEQGEISENNILIRATAGHDYPGIPFTNEAGTRIFYKGPIKERALGCSNNCSPCKPNTEADNFCADGNQSIACMLFCQEGSSAAIYAHDPAVERFAHIGRDKIKDFLERRCYEESSKVTGYALVKDDNDPQTSCAVACMVIAQDEGKKCDDEEFKSALNETLSKYRECDATAPILEIETNSNIKICGNITATGYKNFYYFTDDEELDKIDDEDLKNEWQTVSRFDRIGNPDRRGREIVNDRGPLRECIGKNYVFDSQDLGSNIAGGSDDVDICLCKGGVWQE